MTALQLVQDDIAVSQAVLKRLRARTDQLKSTIAELQQALQGASPSDDVESDDSLTLRRNALMQKERDLRDRLESDAARVSKEEKRLQEEEAQFENLTKEIEAQETALGQLTSELANSEDRIRSEQLRHVASAESDELQSKSEQMKAELCQLEKMLVTKEQSLRDMEGEAAHCGQLKKELEREQLRSSQLSARKADLTEQFRILFANGELSVQEDDFVKRVLLPEISEAAAVEREEEEDSDDEAELELQLIEKSRAVFELHRNERLAALRRDLAAAQNEGYLRILEGEKADLVLQHRALVAGTSS
jgi:chromosome segregation ATPase